MDLPKKFTLLRQVSGNGFLVTQSANDAAWGATVRRRDNSPMCAYNSSPGVKRRIKDLS
jgi:hypothetical protein